MKVRLPASEHRYVEEDFVDSISKILPDGEVLALGHLKRNQEWHITVRSRGSVEKLLQAKQLAVAGQTGAVQVWYSLGTILYPYGSDSGRAIKIW